MSELIYTCSCEAYQKRIEELEAAQAQAVPDGWKLVPKKATAEMCVGIMAVTGVGSMTAEHLWLEILRNSPAAPTPAGSKHPDDVAVDRFAVAMKAKLAKARDKGRGGWDNPDVCSLADLSEALRGHVEKGDPVDVANFCMMLQQRESGIQPSANAAQDVPTIGAVMPNGVMVANVYEAYDAGYMHALKTPAKREG
jgi:hypothetical protein